MSSTFIAFIDESGDEGFRFGKGSSEWFVVSAVIMRSSDEREQVKLINTVRDGLNQRRHSEHWIADKKPLHFRDLSHEQRKFYVEYISNALLRTIVVMIHKCEITSPEKYRQESNLYFYAVRLLVERASWYCRDQKRKNDLGDGSMKLVFSNRSTLDYKELGNYLKYLDSNSIALDYRGAPGIIFPDELCTHSPGQSMGLQIADAVASSYYFAVEKSIYGFTEESYVKRLLSRAYRNEGQLWGYGIKVAPRETEEHRRDGKLLLDWE
jgi:hypothetical protein